MEAAMDVLCIDHQWSRCPYRLKYTCTLQALLEYTVFLPGMLHKDGHQTKLQHAFENFWEAEVPRFGDDGAEVRG